nr:uncharacterized protein LOC117681729 isoform X2 [Crassostrea gigas]
MLRASKVRTSKSKSPYARPPTRGAVVASRASTRMPNVTSSSSGPSTVAVTESTGRIYDRSQSLPVPVVQPTVQPVLDRARAPSDQTVEPSVAGSSTNTDGIWVVGSSIIHWAQKYAQQNIDDNLGLTSQRIIWQGIRGMVWSRLYQTIKEMLRQCNRHPTLLVIHCGGNDIGNPRNTLKGLQKYMKLTVSKITRLLPKTIIVWSHILPRRNRSLCLSNKDGENWRTRLNSALATFVVKKVCGASIKYPDILSTQGTLFRKDGIHLSDLGNELFVTSLKNALLQFMSSTDRFYPLIKQ